VSNGIIIPLSKRQGILVEKSNHTAGKYLQEETYRQFLATYSIAEIESIWNSVFEMCDLFQSTAVELSKKQKFVYDFEQAENSLSFLHHVRKLPANAKEIYP
jgi:aminoglycoside 6-adenylyltransferase